MKYKCEDWFDKWLGFNETAFVVIAGAHPSFRYRCGQRMIFVLIKEQMLGVDEAAITVVLSLL